MTYNSGTESEKAEVEKNKVHKFEPTINSMSRSQGEFIGGESLAVPFGQVLEELPNVDDPDVLEKAESSLALRMALELARPQNWWGIGIDPKAIVAIARTDEIPVVWVPHKGILLELASATDLEARRAVIRKRAAEIVDDCLRLVSECDDPELSDHVQLARKAIETFIGGHHEAAMALAVSIGEPLAVWASTPRVRVFENLAEKESKERQRRKDGKYKWAETEFTEVEARLTTYDLPRQALIAPIPRFFTPWRPESGEPIPEVLSRHVVAHQPSVEHYCLENAVIALMFVSSVLREQQAYCDQVRFSDEEH